MMKRQLVLWLIWGWSATAADTTLWYDKPARDWEKEALPIGNGRLGAMIFGGVERERIQFNEDTLWIGDEKDTGRIRRSALKRSSPVRYAAGT